MDCPFCGERISAGAVKCPNCSEYIGETLSYDEEMKLRARDKAQENYSPKHIARSFSKKERYSWLWNFAAGLILIFIVAGLYFLNKQA